MTTDLNFDDEYDEDGIEFRTCSNCGEEADVDLAIKTKSGYQKYSFTCIKSEDKRTVFLVLNILSPERKEFLADFKSGTEMIIKINVPSCGNEYYTFNLANSNQALQFMMPKKELITDLKYNFFFL